MQINENIRMLAKLKDRWAREKQEEDRIKSLPTHTTLATSHLVEDLKTFSTHHTPSPINGPLNGNVEASTLGQESSTNSEIVKDKINLENSAPTLISSSELDFDNFNLSEVIQFLQKMAKDPPLVHLIFPSPSISLMLLSKLGKKNLD